MELTAEQWDALLEAIDFMAGGDEVLADLWIRLMALKAERVKIEKV